MTTKQNIALTEMGKKVVSEIQNQTMLMLLDLHIDEDVKMACARLQAIQGYAHSAILKLQSAA